MWSALDWTGMLTTAENSPASAPAADSSTATTMSRTTKTARRASSSRTILAEAVEVVAEPTKEDKKLHDTDSDTGGETDSDSDNDVAIPRQDGTRKRTCLVLFLGLVLAAVASGAFAKKAEEGEKDTTKSLEGAVSRNFSCAANSTVDFETADVILNFEGMGREATEAEVQKVQETIAAVYNNVSDGCDDMYQRFMANATIVDQSVVEDSKGGKHLTMGIETSVACDGCGVEDEILFGGDEEEEDSSDDVKRDERKNDRKLRSGNRGIRGSTASTGSGPRVLKAKKGSKKSPNAQEFIDDLDANLQASGLPLKEVKEGFVYKQKGGKKGKDKVKLVPKKNKKEDKKNKKEDKKKEKKDEDDIFTGHLKEDPKRRRRRH